MSAPAKPSFHKHTEQKGGGTPTFQLLKFDMVYTCFQRTRVLTTATHIRTCSCPLSSRRRSPSSHAILQREQPSLLQPVYSRTNKELYTHTHTHTCMHALVPCLSLSLSSVCVRESLSFIISYVVMRTDLFAASSAIHQSVVVSFWFARNSCLKESVLLSEWERECVIME